MPQTLYRYIHGSIIGDSPNLEMCQMSLSSLMGGLWCIHPMGCYTAETEHIKVTSNNRCPLRDIMWRQRNQTQKEYSTAGLRLYKLQEQANQPLVFEVTYGRWLTQDTKDSLEVLVIFNFLTWLVVSWVCLLNTNSLNCILVVFASVFVVLYSNKSFT